MEEQVSINHVWMNEALLIVAKLYRSLSHCHRYLSCLSVAWPLSCNYAAKCLNLLYLTGKPQVKLRGVLKVKKLQDNVILQKIRRQTLCCKQQQRSPLHLTKYLPLKCHKHLNDKCSMSYNMIIVNMG